MSDDQKRDEEFKKAMEQYLAALVSQGYTLEQAKAKALERINIGHKIAVQNRRDALRK